VNSFNDSVRIIRISIAFTIIAALAHALGLTPDNGDINLLQHLQSNDFYMQFGLYLSAFLIPYFMMQRDRNEKCAVLLAGLCAAIVFWFAHPDSWHLKFWSIENGFHSCIGLGIFAVIAVLNGGFNFEVQPHVDAIVTVS